MFSRCAVDLRWFLIFIWRNNIKSNRAHKPGKYFWGNFDFSRDDEYREVEERSDVSVL